MTRVTWLSVDPVNPKVDFYPSYIANKIEQKYKELNDDNNVQTKCILGSDFFNATIHFDNTQNYFYQTTPGASFGRAGYKSPGYRSVQRVIISEDNTLSVIKIYTNKVNNHEWRISKNEWDSVNILTVTVPTEVIIDTCVNYNEQHINLWKPEDLDNPENINKNVIIWQWCLGVAEKQGNLMRLGNEWWTPYLYEQNKQIEEGFQNKEKGVIIQLPYDNSQRTIKLNNDSSFGKQVCLLNKKNRLIRRTIVTIHELIELFENLNKKQLNPEDLLNYVNENQIPHEFFCSISQDIMKNPVKTIDGFTYDRTSIEKWFEISVKSPLTGLNLYSTVLIPNKELKLQMEEFMENIMKTK